MEEKENKTKSEENTHKTNTKQGNPFEGLGGKDMNIPEWLMHLLTGVGTMGANYMLWIKPLQDKMDAMNLKMLKQEDRIRELEDIQEKIIRQLKKDTRGKDEELKGMDDEDFFTINRNNNSKYSVKNEYRKRSFNI